MLIDYGLAGSVSGETNVPVRKRLSWVHASLTPWQLEGSKFARRDDIYKTLFMIANWMWGQSGFTKLLGTYNGDTETFLQWKKDGPLFGWDHCHPFTASVSRSQVPLILEALNSIHSYVMKLEVGEEAVIDYQFIIDQLRRVQGLLAGDPSSV